MNGIRLVIVTHRFWPLSGQSEQVVANLARALLEQGVQPSIVTTRLDARWPTDVVFREIPVHRLPFSQRFGWGTMRYMIVLSRWLRRNLPDIDAVCISRLSHDAHATLGALKGTGIPVIVRAEADESSELQRATKGGRRASRILRRCQEATAIVAVGEGIESDLVSAGFERRQIRLIRDGVATAEVCTFQCRMAARAALAAVNEDLRVGFKMPVATWVGPLQAECRLEELVAAWKIVARKWPDARLWLVGDGPDRERLYRRIRDANLDGRVLMPGTFDSDEDVIRASSLLIASWPYRAASQAMLGAMAAGVPVLVSAEAGHDNQIIDGVSGRVVQEPGPRALAAALLQAFAAPEQALKMAHAAREFVQRHHALAEMARLHRNLFQDLMNSPLRLVR